MKQFFLTAFFGLALAFSVSAQDDAISKYFSKYAEDERFTVVYISPKMFNMISKISTDDPDFESAKEVIKDLKGLRILVADGESEDENGQKIAAKNPVNGMAMYKEAMNTLDMNSYEELLTVRDGQENVRFVVKEDAGTISELLLLVGSPDEFVMLSFAGKINLDKISKLGKSLNVEGAEHLGKIKNKNDE